MVDETQVTHDNNGRFYRIKMDIAKEGSSVWDLTPYFKGRVGDNRFGLQVKWTYQGRTMDVKGMKPYIAGNVGHYGFDEQKDLRLSDDASVVHYVGSPDDCQDAGNVTYYFPEQMFPKDGIFKGYIGLLDDRDSSSQPHISGVTIWFKVLPGIAQMGHACDFYISELEKALQNFKETLRQHNIDYQTQLDSNNAEFQRQVQQVITDARNAYNSQVANSRDAMNALGAEVKANRAELTNINDHLAGVEQQIAIHDIVTIPQHQEDLKNISNAIDERLANVKTAPVAVENAATLQQRYPNGADGIFITADTGHKWLWLSGVWTDCGNYQTPGIESELIKPLQEEQQKHDVQINQNKSAISDNRQQIIVNSNELIRLKSAGQLQDVYITDANGNRITDKNNYLLTGKKWLITTDTTLSQTNIPADAATVGRAIKQANYFDPAKFGIPVLYLYSDRIYDLKDKSMTLKNIVRYSFPHFKASGTLKKIKVQGRTSADLPEKNYTLTFDRDYIFLKEFGYQNKYVIKANYTDFSQAKNVVSARIWGKVRHQHDSLDAITNNDSKNLVDAQGNRILGISNPQLAVGRNAGAVDGMPIAVMINDEFWGLYTLNVPKDGYMAKMPAKNGYAIVSVSWSNLGHQVDTTNTSNFGDVEIEYCGNSSTAWVQSSFNQMLTALNSNYANQSAFDSALGDLLDVDSAIDYYCYSVLIDNIDGINSNFMFQTFNGKKWYIAAYDLDETFGTTKDFNSILRANSNNSMSDLQNGIKHFGMTFENTAKNSQLFAQLWKHHKNDVIKRTQSLVETVMSVEEVSSLFLEFAQNINLNLYIQDAKRWFNKPYTSIVNINQITNWYSQRVAWARKVIDKNI